MDNELKDDLIKSDLEVRYDEHVKKLLSNKKTLAWILKYSASRVQGLHHKRDCRFYRGNTRDKFCRC